MMQQQDSQPHVSTMQTTKLQPTKCSFNNIKQNKKAFELWRVCTRFVSQRLKVNIILIQSIYHHIKQHKQYNSRNIHMDSSLLEVLTDHI